MNRITRDAIKNTALQLFMENGYNNVTIMDICQQLHITKPTFYKYVSSKEDLILDLYDTTIENILSDSYLLIEADTHYEQLLIVFKSLIEETTRYGFDLFSQMLISNLNENRHSLDMRPQLTDLCRAIIEKSQQKHEIQNMNSATSLYKSIAYAFSGYEFNWCVYKGDFDWETQFFESIRDILCVRDDLREVHLKYLK